jgi:Holliday junction resolvasome RuvABC endonuclease subunit
MKLLSIDPASAKPHGVAAWSNGELLMVSHMTSGDVLAFLRSNPDYAVVAVEDQYFHKNVDTLKKLSHATGALKFIAEMQDVDFYWVNPAKWQKHHGITARGKDKKTEYIKIATALYPTLNGLSVDQACAILIGLYWYSAKEQLCKIENKSS